MLRHARGPKQVSSCQTMHPGLPPRPRGSRAPTRQPGASHAQRASPELPGRASPARRPQRAVCPSRPSWLARHCRQGASRAPERPPGALAPSAPGGRVGRGPARHPQALGWCVGAPRAGMAWRGARRRRERVATRPARLRGLCGGLRKGVRGRVVAAVSALQGLHGLRGFRGAETPGVGSRRTADAGL